MGTRIWTKIWKPCPRQCHSKHSRDQHHLHPYTQTNQCQTLLLHHHLHQNCQRSLTTKNNPNCVHLIAGGNLIDYPSDLTICTADLTTTKILWNSVISIEGACYLCLDIKIFYLGTPMDCFEYMKMPHFPVSNNRLISPTSTCPPRICLPWSVEAINELPQAGILANQLLRKCQCLFCYYNVAPTPGLWKHIMHSI